jgi:hypothetical protein
MLSVNFVDLSEVIHVLDEYCQTLMEHMSIADCEMMASTKSILTSCFDNLIEANTGFFQDGSEVLQCLLCLLDNAA